MFFLSGTVDEFSPVIFFFLPSNIGWYYCQWHTVTLLECKIMKLNTDQSDIHNSQLHHIKSQHCVNNTNNLHSLHTVTDILFDRLFICMCCLHHSILMEILPWYICNTYKYLKYLVCIHILILFVVFFFSIKLQYLVESNLSLLYYSWYIYTQMYFLYASRLKVALSISLNWSKCGSSIYQGSFVCCLVQIVLPYRRHVSKLQERWSVIPLSLCLQLHNVSCIFTFTR